MKKRMAVFTILFLSIACSSKIQEHQINTFAFTHVTIINPTSIHPEEQYAIRMLRAGADGYVRKDSLPDDFFVTDDDEIRTAAPELVAALEVAYPVTGRKHDLDCPYMRGAIHTCNCKTGAARAAIAKAKGGK